MAKRKRLTPARGAFADLPETVEPQPEGPRNAGLRPPIAQVAGDSSTSAAFEELAQTLTRAREEGRLVQSLPLAQIVADHLVRDRMESGAEDMEALKQSLISRGQQTPIEVTALPPASDGTPRFGLISGWRRLQALRRLSAETGEARFDTVLALLRRPEDQAEAYVAMVEENEIRADLSFFERARIVLRAVEGGVFDSEKQALQSLFSAASYAKRSKIKSFIPIVAALDGALRFPTQLTERSGLAIAKILAETPGLGAQAAAALTADPAPTPEAEAERLRALILEAETGSVSPEKREAKPARPKPAIDQITPALRLKSAPGRIELSGADVDPQLEADLRAWLQDRVK
ncbi:ParB/RepB/Spo0J family partition protein [Pseudooceanicola atlanticus]|uniref:ParB-like N-terminal domain-containing protein n=1 Tax=Pseudooceanicola atlanticus TaxID=1461694 RepID=A0A0A0EC11_9RHOB|nr:ParB N-terminal domain-containing protein [Pseudooceanicola atlanticus]KGM46762.1 hypothetical protein ATO9_22110 [Pseudooceanicola atlanticus]